MELRKKRLISKDSEGNMNKFIRYQKYRSQGNIHMKKNTFNETLHQSAYFELNQVCGLHHIII